jgi:hypothetical protein
MIRDKFVLIAELRKPDVDGARSFALIDQVNVYKNRFSNQLTFRHSSRKLPLTTSTYPFCRASFSAGLDRVATPRRSPLLLWLHRQ